MRVALIKIEGMLIILVFVTPLNTWVQENRLTSHILMGLIILIRFKNGWELLKIIFNSRVFLRMSKYKLFF